MVRVFGFMGILSNNHRKIFFLCLRCVYRTRPQCMESWFLVTNLGIYMYILHVIRGSYYRSIVVSLLRVLANLQLHSSQLCYCHNSKGFEDNSKILYILYKSTFVKDSYYTVVWNTLQINGNFLLLHNWELAVANSGKSW